MPSDATQLLDNKQDDYIPIFCAAHWIVKQGGMKQPNLGDFCIWQSAYRELIAAITSGKLTVVGIERDEANYNPDNGSESRDVVPGYKFSDCAIQCPYCASDFDLAFGSRAWLLRSFPFEDEDDWHDGFSDALLNRARKGWVQLMVSKKKITKKWPPGSLEPAKPRGAGRPGMEKIKSEYIRRVEAGKENLRTGEEAQFLMDWYKENYPDHPPYKKDSIENAIRRWRKQLKPLKK